MEVKGEEEEEYRGCCGGLFTKIHWHLGFSTTAPYKTSIIQPTAIHKRKIIRTIFYSLAIPAILILLPVIAAVLDLHPITFTDFVETRPFLLPVFYLCNPNSSSYADITVLSETVVFDQGNETSVTNYTTITVSGLDYTEKCLILKSPLKTVDDTGFIIFTVWKVTTTVSYNQSSSIGKRLGRHLFISEAYSSHLTTEQTDVQYISLQDYSSISFNEELLMKDVFFPTAVSTLPMIGSLNCTLGICIAQSITSIRLDSSYILKLTEESIKSHVFRIFSDWGGLSSVIMNATAIIIVVVAFLLLCCRHESDESALSIHHLEQITAWDGFKSRTLAK